MTVTGGVKEGVTGRPVVTGKLLGHRIKKVSPAKNVSFSLPNRHSLVPSLVPSLLPVTCG